MICKTAKHIELQSRNNLTYDCWGPGPQTPPHLYIPLSLQEGLDAERQWGYGGEAPARFGAGSQWGPQLHSCGEAAWGLGAKPQLDLGGVPTRVPNYIVAA